MTDTVIPDDALAAKRARRLLDLPAYWINMDKAVERRGEFFFSAEQFWRGPITRITGVDGADISDEDVKLFTDNRRLKAGKEMRDVYPARVTMISRGSLGCLRGHVSALRRGIYDGHKRFVVMEDDAALRVDLLKNTPPPPFDAEFVAWGGVPMLAFKSDDERFLSNAAQGWVPLRATSRFYGAHCYEVTEKAARALVAIFEREEQTTDDGWHELFQKVPAYRAKTQIATQKSGSVSMINNKAREAGIA